MDSGLRGWGRTNALVDAGDDGDDHGGNDGTCAYSGWRQGLISQAGVGSSLDPRRSALRKGPHFRQRGHGGISRVGGDKGAMRPAHTKCLLGCVTCHEPVEESGCETVTPPTRS